MRALKVLHKGKRGTKTDPGSQRNLGYNSCGYRPGCWTCSATRPFVLVAFTVLRLVLTSQRHPVSKIQTRAIRNCACSILFCVEQF